MVEIKKGDTVIIELASTWKISDIAAEEKRLSERLECNVVIIQGGHHIGGIIKNPEAE